MDPVVASTSPGISSSKTSTTPAQSFSSKLSWRAPTKAAISSPTPTVASPLASAAPAVATPRSVKQLPPQSHSVPPPSASPSWPSPTSLVSTRTTQQRQRAGAPQTPPQDPHPSNTSTHLVFTQNTQSYFSQLSSRPSPSHTNLAGKNVADLITASTSSSPFGPQSPLSPQALWSSSSVPSHANPDESNAGLTEGAKSPISPPSHPHEGTPVDLPPHVLAQLGASLHYSSQTTSNGACTLIPHPFAQTPFNGGQPGMANPSPYFYYNNSHNLPHSGMS